MVKRENTKQNIKIDDTRKNAEGSEKPIDNLVYNHQNYLISLGPDSEHIVVTNTSNHGKKPKLRYPLTGNVVNFPDVRNQNIREEYVEGLEVLKSSEVFCDNYTIKS